MSSTRLPGKVLMPIMGIPILQHITNSLRQKFSSQEILIITSTDTSDTAIADFCVSRGISVWRGSLDNVALRFYDALMKFMPDTFIRICADSPLFDYRQAVIALQTLENSHADLASSVGQNFPSGLNVEAFRTDVYIKNFPKFNKPEHLEHVTAYFYQNESQFQIKRLPALELTAELNNSKFSVDTKDDLLFVEEIFKVTGADHFKFDIVKKCEIAHLVKTGKNP